MHMRRKATAEEFPRIMAVLDQVYWQREGNFFQWGPTPETEAKNKAEAKRLSKAIANHWPSRSCYACYMQVVDILRIAVGLPAVSRPISAERYRQRMETCKTCPAFHPKTVSCGRLGIDWLTPKAVEINGVMVDPCGCALLLKANMKHAACPAGLWR